MKALLLAMLALAAGAVLLEGCGGPVQVDSSIETKPPLPGHAKKQGLTAENPG